VAITLGVSAGYSDAVTLDIPFGVDATGKAVFSTYIIVGTTGDIVWRGIPTAEDPLGELNFLQNVSSGTTLGIAATEIVTGGTVRGTPRLTTPDMQLSALWSNQY
jgi:hypothetical protein